MFVLSRDANSYSWKVSVLRVFAPPASRHPIALSGSLRGFVVLGDDTILTLRCVETGWKLKAFGARAYREYSRAHLH